MFSFDPDCESPDCTHPEDPADADTNGTVDGVMYVHTDCGIALLEAAKADLLEKLENLDLTLENLRS